MSWQDRFGSWLHGVLGGFIGSAASSVTVVVVDPLDFNPFNGGGAKLATVAVISGLVGAALYLKQHPLPDLTD